MKNNRFVVEITTGFAIKAILFLLFLYTLFYLKDIVIIVLFSVVLASAIEPATTRLEKFHIPRVIALILIYLFVFAVLGFLLYLIIPTFVNELSNFASEVPSYFEDPNRLRSFFGFIPDLPEYLSGFLGDTFGSLQEQIGFLKEKVGDFGDDFFGGVSKIFGGAMSFILIIVLSFYLAVQKNGLENFIRVVTPTHYEKYILNLWNRSRRKIGLWLQGQILLGLLVGILVFLGLSILRVKYALSFALLAAVFEIIPIFGPILAAIPPVIVALIQNPTLGLVVIVLFIIIQQFENHLIYPLVVRKIVGIPPIMAILAIIIGGKLGGFFGVLLAIPLATVLKEFLDDIAEKKHIAVK